MFEGNQQKKVPNKFIAKRATDFINMKIIPAKISNLS